jgi:actin-related protein 2
MWTGPPDSFDILFLFFEKKNFPEHQYPSIVGRPILRAEERAGDVVVKDIMCGEEAAAARTMLQISYPVRPQKTPVPPPMS